MNSDSLDTDAFARWVAHAVNMVLMTAGCGIARKEALTYAGSGVVARQPLIDDFFEGNNSGFMRLPSGVLANLEVSEEKRPIH